MHFHRLVAPFLISMLFAAAVHGSPDPMRRVRLVLSLAPTAAPATPSQVSVELRAGDDVRQITAPLPGEVTIAVPAGVTYVQVVSDAYWSGSRAFEVAEDDQLLGVEVHPAGVVTGSVTLADDKQVLPSANAIFIAHDRAAPWSKSTVVPCSVTALEWSCVIPAGRHDLRLRVPGYVSAYYVDTNVAAGKRLKVAAAKLLPGASLVGTVAVEKAPRGARPTVTLEPQRLAMHDDAGTTFRTDVVRADEQGFFHFDGVAPGRYSLVATLPGYASARGSAQVIDGRESELLEPLLIEKARALELSIEPPVDFSGKPWTVTVMAERPGAFYETVTQGAVGPDGRFGWKGARGTYKVQIASAEGKAWREQPVIIDGDPSRAHIAIEPRRIHGLVRLGGEPLRAKLAFQQRYGPEAESNDAGEFSALVPPPDNGAWRVTVTSESAGVNRQVIVPAPKDGDAVRIDLPAARLAGVVRDQQGNGVENAIVTVSGEKRTSGIFTQVRSGAGGMFRVAALEADRYGLSAEGRPGESDNLFVTLAEEEDRRIEIVLLPSEKLHGSVLSPYGPLSGAELYIEPLQGSVTNRMHYTDAAGRFQARLPRGTETYDLAISAPGFARSFFRIPHQKGRKLKLHLDQVGGTLVLDVPKSSALPLTTWTYLVRGEARLMLGLAQRWGVVRASSGEDRYTLEVPQMEIGPYRLCATAATGIPNSGPLDPKRCVSGVLAPYGRLTLRLD